MQKRILIVRTDRVGDVIMITPVIRELRKTFPDAFIATLTNTNTEDILINNLHLNLTLTDDLKKDSFGKIVSVLRKYKFNNGLLMMPTERAAYQMFLAGIKNRIGVGHKLYEAITFMKSVSRNKYVPLRHEADYCMDLARKIGVTSDNLSPEIFLTEEETLWGDKFLSDNGVKENDYKIIVHTGSKNSSPNWSENKYLELIKGILYTFNKKLFKIILTANEMTEVFINKTRELNDERIINISLKINSLRDLIKVINSADLIISSSTGPAHISDSLRKNAITIHCNRAMNCSKHWGALNNKSIDLQVSNQYCDNHCSIDKKNCDIENGLTVADVIKKIII